MSTDTLPPGLLKQVMELNSAQRAELVSVIDELDAEELPSGPRTVDEIHQLLIQRMEASHSGAVRGTTAEESIETIRNRLLKHGIV